MHLQVRHLDLLVANRCLLKDFCLSFTGGQHWAVLGANGVGKSTLLQLLAGLKPSIDKVYIDNSPLESYTRKALARQLTILLQHSEFYLPESVWTCVSKGLYASRTYWQWRVSPQQSALLDQVLALVDLAVKAQQCVTTLSGGERQRVAIARVLVQQGQILLLDEPCTHLDLSHQIFLMRYLSTLVTQQRRLIISVMHDVNMAAKFCSHVLLLFADGSYLAGTKQEILTDMNLKRLYGQGLIRHVAAADQVWIYE